MEKFTKRELLIFNLIKQGKSKSDILGEIQTTPANFAAALTGIFKKTDEFVGYHTERTKFEELKAYLRNNPTMFTPIPANDSECESEIKEEIKPKEEIKTIKAPGVENDFKKELGDFLKTFMNDLEQEKAITKAKIEVVSAIQNKFGIYEVTMEKENKNCPSYDCGNCETSPFPYSVKCSDLKCKWQNKEELEKAKKKFLAIKKI